MSQKVYDVIIIGSGPAGLTAGLYTARANLATLLLAGMKWGGQLQLTTEVENYPGFPKGILGPDLMKNIRAQAVRFGAEIIDKDFVSADFTTRPFRVKSYAEEHLGRSVIVASGADTRWLGVPGEEKFLGRGISSCAPCDAFFYRGKEVIVVGGGDSAMEEALVLTKFATRVTVVHRREEFRASKIMQERVKSHPKIKILWNTAVKEIIGKDKVERVKLETVGQGGREMAIDGVFVAIGHTPNTARFKGVDLDSKGYVKRRESYDPHGLLRFFTATSVGGVFTAGDVHDYRYKQAVTAAGFGCMAALDVEKWLEEEK